MNLCPFCLPDSGGCWLGFAQFVEKQYAEFREDGNDSYLELYLPTLYPEGVLEPGDSWFAESCDFSVNFSCIHDNLTATLWCDNVDIEEWDFWWGEEAPARLGIREPRKVGSEVEALAAAVESLCKELPRYGYSPKDTREAKSDWNV